MKPRLRARVVIPYIVLVVFIGIGLLIARPLQEFIHQRLLAIQVELVALVKKSTGLTMRYDQLNPSILLQAEISGFRLLRNDGSVFFSADSMRISYNIFQFLGAVPLDAVHSVELEGSRLSWDETQDTLFRPKDPRVAAATGTKPGVAWLRTSLDELSRILPKGLRLSFLETNVNLKGRDWQAGFLVSRSELVSSSERLNFMVDVDIAVQSLAALHFFGAVSGQLRAEGTFFRMNREIQAQVSTGRFQTALGSLAPQQFAAVLGSDSLRFRKVEDNQAFDLQLAWNFNTDIVNFDLATDHWHPANAFAADTTLDPAFRSILEASYSATINASYALKTAELLYEFNLDGRGQTASALPVLLIAQGKGSQRRMDKADIHMEFPGFRSSYQGVVDFAGSGTQGLFEVGVSAPVLSVPVSLRASLNGDIHHPGTGFILGNCQLKTGETSLGLESIPLIFAGGRFTFAVSGAVLRETGNDGAFNVAGSIGMDPNSPFLILGGTVQQTSLHASRGLVRTIVALAGANLEEKTLKGIPKNLLASGNFEMTLGQALNLTVKDLVVGVPDAVPLYAGTLRFADETLISENSRLDLGFAAWTMDAQLHFVKNAALSLVLNLDRGKTGAIQVNGKLQPDNTFELQGPYGFYMDGDLADGGVRAFARIENVPMVQCGPASRMGATVRFNLDQNDNWLLTIRDADITNIAWNPVYPGRPGRLIIRNALFYPTTGRVTELRYQDGTSTLVGTADLHYDLASLPDLVADIKMESRPSIVQPLANPAPERLSLAFKIVSGGLHAAINIENSSLQRFNDNIFRGVFNLAAQVDSPLNQLADAMAIKGQLRIDQAFMFKEPLAANLAFNFAKGKFYLDTGTVELPGKMLQLDNLGLDMAMGRLEVQARYSQPQDPAFRAVDISGSATWNPQLAPGSSPFFNGFKGYLSAGDIQGVDGKLHNYVAHLTGSNRVLEISESSNNAFRGRILEDGAFIVQLQEALPLTATISGFVRGNKLEANIANINVDLSTLSGLLNISLFKLVGGTLNGSLRVVGDVFDPDFYGSLRVNAMKARFSMTPEDITAPLGYLVFEEKKMRLLGVQVTAGPTSARIDGDFTLSRLGVSTFQMNFETMANSALHIVSNFSNISVDGWGKGRFSVIYSPTVLDLRGQLTVENAKMQISPQPVLAKAAVSPYERETLPLTVNLELKSGRSVEFFWPSSSFPLLRTTLDLNQTAAFSLNQNSGAWSLVGNVATRGGEIMYLKRNFYLRQASLNFNENQNKDFDPIVNARADTKIMFDNQSAKVALVFKDNFLSNLQPRIESDLLLSTAQLNAVLSGDFVTVNANNGDTTNALIINSVGFASAALLPNVESRIRDFLGLDLFSLRSNLIPNLAKSVLSSYRNPLDNQTTSWGKYFDDTTLQIGKFIGTDVYFELMAQVRAASTYGAYANPLGLTVDFELSTEWETPFFNLQWNLAPKNLWQQPDLRDFLRNNKFQFSWQIR